MPYGWRSGRWTGGWCACTTGRRPFFSGLRRPVFDPTDGRDAGWVELSLSGTARLRAGDRELTAEDQGTEIVFTERGLPVGRMSLYDHIDDRLVPGPNDPNSAELRTVEDLPANLVLLMLGYPLLAETVRNL